MSSATKKKGHDSKESEILDQPDQGQTTQAPQIWPEWSDADINSEKWGNPVIAAKPDKKGGKKPSASADKKSTKTDKSAATKATDITVTEEKFEDQFEVPLPWSLRKTRYVHWHRPETMIDPNIKLVVFSPNSPCLPDLVTKNRHLFRSSFMRSVVSAIYMLCYIGQTKPFLVEWETPLFQSNTEDQPWKPWFHIYSIGRAGKGQIHNPIANTLGKYVVRLYWLGCWRKFIVDDRCPRDEKGQHLLPLSYVEEDKEFELWPMLLSKVLLKIASLTWTPEIEIVDFDVVTCLTGWPVQKVFTKGMDPQDVWEMCCGYSSHYTWDMKLILETVEEDKPPQNASEKSSKRESTRGTTLGSQQDKTSTKGTKSVKDALGLPKYFYLTATCSDLSALNENEIEDITPCFEHDFLIEETRDIPLIEKIPEYDRNLSRWKEYRWVDWAVDHGIWDKVYDWEIYKCMRIVSSMRKFNEDEMYNIEISERGNFIKHSAEIIEEFVEKKIQEMLAAEKKKGGKDTAKKEKAPKTPKSPTKKQKQSPFIDPSIWSDFSKLAPYITCVSIYLKPSCFKVTYIVSDIPFAGSDTDPKKKAVKKDEKKGKGGGTADEGSLRHLYWENSLMKSRNDTIYLFTDSIDSKLTIFSLTHLGNKLPEPVIKLEDEEHEPKCDMLICKKGKCEHVLCTCQSDTPEATILEEEYTDNRKYAYLMIEDYKWNSNKLGDMSTFLNTCGTKSILIDLDKGRHVKRMWVRSESPYVLLVFCDTEMRVGRADEILECMEAESEQITQICYDICYNFGNLIRYFGFPEYNSALKDYYNSYLPPVRLSKKQLDLIHTTFLEEVKKVIINIFPPDKYYELARAFKILFLNPKFVIPYLKEIEKEETVSETYVREDCLCDDIDFIKLQESAATKIQAYFKMIFIKKLKALHNPLDKKFQPVLDLLKQVYQNVFSSKVRNINIDLLKSFVVNKNVENIIQYYPFYKDIDLVVNMIQFSGDVLDVEENSWVPLVRRVFFCNTSDPVIIRAYIFCALPIYVLRIINNDNGKEIERYTNNTLVSKYEKNEKGYTVLGYGWTDVNPEKCITWKLYLVIEKILSSCPIVCNNVNNVPHRIKGNYIPNNDNLIAKFTIKFYETGLGTFHFQAIHPDARIRIKCLNDTGEVIFEATGKSSVLIPVVNLIRNETDDSRRTSSDTNITRKKSFKSRTESLLSKRRKTSTEKKSHVSSIKKLKGSSFSSHEEETGTEYLLQVYVMENSWPLTASEWEFVQNLQKDRLIENELNLSKLSLNQEKKERLPQSSTSKTSKEKSLTINKAENKSPNWILTNFTDSTNSCIVKIDERRMEEIKDIKRKLFVDNVQRFAEGKVLRSEFLESQYIEWDFGTDANFENEFRDYRSVSMALPPGAFHVGQHKVLDEFRRKLSDDIRTLSVDLLTRMSISGSTVPDLPFLQKLSSAFQDLNILKYYAESEIEQKREARSASVALGTDKFHVKELHLLSDFSKRLSEDIKKFSDIGFVARMSSLGGLPETRGYRSASMQAAPGTFHVKQFQLPEDFTEIDDLDRAIAEGSKYRDVRSASQALPSGIFSTKQLQMTPEMYKEMMKDMTDENLMNQRKLSLEFEDPDPGGPRSASIAVPAGTFHIKQRQIDLNKKDSDVIPEHLIKKPERKAAPVEIPTNFRSVSMALQPDTFHVKQQQLESDVLEGMTQDLAKFSTQKMTVLEGLDQEPEYKYRSASSALPAQTFHVKQYQMEHESVDDITGISQDSLPYDTRTIAHSQDFTSIRSVSMSLPNNVHLFHILQTLQKHVHVDYSFCAGCHQSLSDEDIRYIRPPESLDKMLPPFDLNECDDEKDKHRKLVGPEDSERIIQDINKKVQKFDEAYNEFLTDMEYFNEERKRRNEFLLNWYGEIRNASSEISKNAEIRRQEVINKIKEKAAAATAGTKDKKKGKKSI